MPPAKSAIVLEMDRTNTRFLGFFPFHRTTTTNGTRSSRPEYGPLPGEDSDRDSNSKDDLQLEKDDAGHGNTYFVNKASRPLRISSWTNRQRWLACGTVFGLFFLCVFFSPSIFFSSSFFWKKGGGFIHCPLRVAHRLLTRPKSNLCLPDHPRLCRPRPLRPRRQVLRQLHAHRCPVYQR